MSVFMVSPVEGVLCIQSLLTVSALSRIEDGEGAKNVTPPANKLLKLCASQVRPQRAAIAHLGALYPGQLSSLHHDQQDGALAGLG